MMMPDPIERRKFLQWTASATALAAWSGASLVEAAPAADAARFVGLDAETEALIRTLVEANDRGIPEQRARQEKRTGRKDTGAMPTEHGIPTAGATSGFILSLASAACAPGSRYYRSPELAEPLRLAAGYMQAAQHEDGTVDYYATNFRSPPDTAFILENMGPACQLLRASPEPALAAVAEELGRFIVKAADGLAVGGVHTPNHRWVVCSALAWANSLYPNLRYVARIDQWLAETIDIDPDGQYTERSTTVYSPIVDRALLAVARLLGRPELREPVRRNLEMTWYYVHPDGEVVTEASRRQDRAQRATLARYYPAYRALAIADGNGKFAAVARGLQNTSRAQLTGDLAAFLTEPELRRALPPDAALPTDYERVFTYSGLARIRRGAVSATILAGNATVFTFRKGGVVLEALRWASAFFGKGQFVGEPLEVKGPGRYRLRQELEGPYYQPLSAEQIAHGDHVRMAPNGTLANDSRALRAKSNLCRLTATLDIEERAGKFRLAFDVRGTDGVAVSIELAFREGVTLTGVEPAPDVKQGYLLRSGQGRASVGEQSIEFGPGHVEHTYTQVRGALPKWEGPCVYLTGLTPFATELILG